MPSPLSCAVARTKGRFVRSTGFGGTCWQDASIHHTRAMRVTAGAVFGFVADGSENLAGRTSSETWDADHQGDTPVAEASTRYTVPTMRCCIPPRPACGPLRKSKMLPASDDRDREQAIMPRKSELEKMEESALRILAEVASGGSVQPEQKEAAIITLQQIRDRRTAERRRMRRAAEKKAHATKAERRKTAEEISDRAKEALKGIYAAVESRKEHE